MKALRLEFAPAVPALVRARISSAFMNFAALHGFGVAGPDDHAAHVLYYGETATIAGATWVPARYVARPPSEPAPTPIWTTHGGEALPLFFGVASNGAPDWLGETFEWLSGAHEHSIRERDAIGRIPYAASVFARFGISPLRPWAALVLAWLRARIDGGRADFQTPESPTAVKHWVLPSHDLDYYWNGRPAAAWRILKNLGIAARARNFAFARDTVHEGVRLVRGERPGDFAQALASAANRLGFTSTVFAIARHAHRRDANYRLADIRTSLEILRATGFTIALHGSYQSVSEGDDLAAEADLLRGTHPAARGSRQHWLRFPGHARLFDNLERAGMRFDSTLGFPDACGFRNGACFAFVPYDFAREQPCRFIEIPLVAMDTTLMVAAPADAARVARKVLTESRNWGYGGVSILWHNPIETLNTTTAINRIFWELCDERAANHEAWVSADVFMARITPRFVSAELAVASGAIATGAGSQPHGGQR